MKDLNLIKAALESKKTVTFASPENREVFIDDVRGKITVWEGTNKVLDAREKDGNLQVLLDYFNAWIEVLATDNICLDDKLLTPKKWDSKLRQIFQNVKDAQVPAGAKVFFQDSPLDVKDLDTEKLCIHYGTHCSTVYAAEWGGDLWNSELDVLRNDFSIYQKLDFKF